MVLILAFFMISMINAENTVIDNCEIIEDDNCYVC